MKGNDRKRQKDKIEERYYRLSMDDKPGKLSEGLKRFICKYRKYLRVK